MHKEASSRREIMTAYVAGYQASMTQRPRGLSQGIKNTRLFIASEIHSIASIQEQIICLVLDLFFVNTC